MHQLPYYMFIIGSYNGLLPALRQAVALQNVTELIDTIQWNQNQNTIHSTTKFTWLCSMQNVDNFVHVWKKKKF